MESLVILVAIHGGVADTARHVLAMVRAFAVPVVFITDEPPDEMRQLLQAYGARHPFIAGCGTQIHVPKGYFPGLLDTEPDDESDWHVLRLQLPGADGGDAVRLLMALYRFGGDPVVFVGLGEHWAHRAVLSAVDVPVIVRNDGIDQARLFQSVPGAYFTTAAGPAGCTEAILGAACDCYPHETTAALDPH